MLNQHSSRLSRVCSEGTRGSPALPPSVPTHPPTAPSCRPFSPCPSVPQLLCHNGSGTHEHISGDGLIRQRRSTSFTSYNPNIGLQSSFVSLSPPYAPCSCGWICGSKFRRQCGESWEQHWAELSFGYLEWFPSATDAKDGVPPTDIIDLAGCPPCRFDDGSAESVASV